MGSKIFIPATKPEDWKSLLAEPEKHWRKGYSARSLAYCWQEAEGFPECVKKAFSQSNISILHNIELLLAIPEYQVSLPGGSRPSQNDIFVLAKGDGQLISITVEGKVSEPFDKTISEWLQDRSRGKQVRLNFLCNELDLDKAMVSNIRYQLLHRTASAIIEAKKFNAPNALMLVHSFSLSNEWFADYYKFASLFGLEAELNRIHFASNIGGIKLHLGWVKGEKEYLSK
jgi:hypothetical protein